MSWTAPTTRSTGDLISAATWNTDLVNNLTWLATAHGCRAYRNGALSIPNNALTIIGLDAELFDSDGYHDTVTNPSRLTIPTGLGGIYSFLGQLAWNVSPATTQLEVLLDGGFQGLASYNDNALWKQVGLVASLVAGDYLEYEAKQTSGAGVAIQTGSGYTWAALEMVGL